MNIHWFQHVPFEDLGSIEPHLSARGHHITASHLWRDPLTHDPEDLDWLIIMGGPMSVHDEHIHPWLAEEKQFIRKVIDDGKPVLGICLGAQLVAEVLGATISQNEHREIGWFPITREAEPEASPVAAVFPDMANVFHWHGDTFSLPDGAIRLASSEACENQGFIWNGRVVALQFHLESTQASTENLIAHCIDELDGSTWVQQPSRIMQLPHRFRAINLMMNRVLDAMEGLAN